MRDKDKTVNKRGIRTIRPSQGAREPEPFRELHMRRLSKAKISQGKALIAKMRESQRECMVAESAAIYDDVYTKAIEFLDGEGLDLQIEGEARIEDKRNTPILKWFATER